MHGGPISRKERLSTLCRGTQAVGLPFDVQGFVISRVKAGSNKKRPKLFSLGRLGSPPPELPNYNCIVARRPGSVNVTSVIQIRETVMQLWLGSNRSHSRLAHIIGWQQRRKMRRKKPLPRLLHSRSDICTGRSADSGDGSTLYAKFGRRQP